MKKSLTPQFPSGIARVLRSGRKLGIQQGDRHQYNRIRFSARKGKPSASTSEEYPKGLAEELKMGLDSASFEERMRARREGRRGGPILIPDDAETEEEYFQGATCKVFIDRNGEFREGLCCDYGFRKGTQRMYEDGMDGQIPASAWELGMANFKQEFTALRCSFRYNEYKSMRAKAPLPRGLAEIDNAVGSAIVGAFAWADKKLEELGALGRLPEDPEAKAEQELAKSCVNFRSKLDQMVLSNDAVWEREKKRDEIRGPNFTPPYVRVVYLALCYFLDFYFNNRPIQRFWFLESVARMPYFSYITMLHLYESLGWWRAGAKLRKVHFAEEWNELHHLMIMESLGGDRYWMDRFMAGHASIFYYVVLCILFFFNPKLAYNFSELIEGHAVDTYGEFVDANEELLKSMPPPYVALNYYLGSDLYLFDTFQTYYMSKAEQRRPECTSLYDVFSNVRDDEGQHVETMAACQDARIVKDFESMDQNLKY
mmetsp:Transcript_39031/g.92464  ORF Transcript_39031/g.92464 Transcript_39031/m.92464 type:complete len:484 (-) Transcript_39031:160-1611(-)